MSATRTQLIADAYRQGLSTIEGTPLQGLSGAATNTAKGRNPGAGVVGHRRPVMIIGAAPTSADFDRGSENSDSSLAML